METSAGTPPGLGLSPVTWFVFSLGSLYGYLAQLTDRRKRRGLRYPLATVLVLAILAKLRGHASRKPSGIADWVQRRQRFFVEALRLKRDRAPHPTT